MTILGIAGSLRRQSYNRGALRAAQQLAPEGVTLDIFEIDGIPGFSEDDEKNPPAKVVEFKKRIRAADALLFVHNANVATQVDVDRDLEQSFGLSRCPNGVVFVCCMHMGRHDESRLRLVSALMFSNHGFPAASTGNAHCGATSI